MSVTFDRIMQMRAADCLRAAAAQSGIIEEDGVPRVVQYMTYYSPMYMFIVLLFDGRVIHVSGEAGGLGLMERPTAQHYESVMRETMAYWRAGMLKRDSDHV